MCGIIGTTNQNISEEEFARSLAFIRHRGPDNEGMEKNHSILFGHSRLAIIDLDERSNQPFSYSHGENTYLITFNGEIYNYLELKSTLINAGYNFKTSSDTEVICACFDFYGTSCFDHFEGMWAIAINIGDKLILSRDRVGKKPFYIGVDKDGSISFSSSLQAVSYLLNSKTIDTKALELYFALGFVPDKYSIFQNISKLLPGETIEYRVESGKAELIERKMSVYINKDSFRKKSFKMLFRQAVDKRLISDVPITTLMSGGVDSTIVTAEIKNTQPDTEAYFVDFEDKVFSEKKWADYLSQRNSIRLNTILLSSRQLEDAFKDYYLAYEEPFADYSGIPSIAIFKETAKKYKVVLTGDGGDELFFGYPHYFKKLVLYRFSGILKLIGKFQKLPKSINAIISGKKEDFESNYLSNHGVVTPFARKFLNDVFNGYLRKNNSFLKALVDYDRTFYNWPEKYLVKVDRSSMFAGIEVRSPFLDESLIVKTNRIPLFFLFTPYSSKLFLKIKYLSYFGLKYLTAKKKGFTPPIQTLRDQYFKAQDFEDLKSYLSSLSPEVYGLTAALTYSDLLKDKILFDRFFFFNEWRRKTDKYSYQTDLGS